MTEEPESPARRHNLALLGPALLLALGGGLALPGAARATDVNLVGIFPGKAVLSIDGGPPRTVGIGASVAGVKLLAVERDSATLEVDGRTQVLSLGQFVGGSANNARKTIRLLADARGHFVVQGSVNGGSLNFLVDTGATLIVMSAADASRLGIAWRDGQRLMARTANGVVGFYRVVLDNVRIGEIVLNQVEAGVQEAGMQTGIALLGMSFLNRMEIQQSGQTMVLTQRF